MWKIIGWKKKWGKNNISWLKKKLKKKFEGRKILGKNRVNIFFGKFFWRGIFGTPFLKSQHWSRNSTSNMILKIRERFNSKPVFNSTPIQYQIGVEKMKKARRWTAHNLSTHGNLLFSICILTPKFFFIKIVTISSKVWIFLVYFTDILSIC